MNEVGARTLEYLRGERDLLEERERAADLRRKVEASNLSYWVTGANRRRVERFWQMVSLLKGNSRMTLVEMSRNLKVPVSTVFDTLKDVEKIFNFTIVLKGNEKNMTRRDAITVGDAYQITNTCEEDTITLFSDEE